MGLPSGLIDSVLRGADSVNAQVSSVMVSALYSVSGESSRPRTLTSC